MAKVHEEETYLKDFWANIQRKRVCQCTAQHTFKIYGMLAPPPLSPIGSKFEWHAPVSSALPRNALRSLLITVNYQRPWLSASCGYKQWSTNPFTRSSELLSNLELTDKHWIYIWRKISSFYFSVKWNTSLQKEIPSVPKNLKNVSLWTYCISHVNGCFVTC